MTEQSARTPIRRLIATALGQGLPAGRDGTRVIVLDPGWVPVAQGRPDLIPVGELLGRVVESIDVAEEALQRIDAWALETGLVDRLAVEDTTYWFRVRETMWRWLHERLLWLHAFHDLDLEPGGLAVEVPTDEDAIADVAAAFGATVIGASGPADEAAAGPGRRPSSTTAKRVRALFATLRRRSRTTPARQPAAAAADPRIERNAAREALLEERVELLTATPGRRILVLTTPASFQQIGGPADMPRDPNLGAVIERLPGAGYQVVRIGMGLDARRDEDWALVEHSDDLLPFSLLTSRWSGPADADRAATSVGRVEASLAELPASTALVVDGIDLGASAANYLRSVAARLIRNDVRQRARVERLVAELRPEAILLTQEGIRLPWLTAARAADIPTFAVQHGVLYRGHAGYAPARHPRLVLADRTFVYGEFERRVLVDQLAYEPADVEVSGSPRLDLDQAANSRSGVERVEIRARLGVADGDRMLIVSTTHLPFYQRSHLVHMFRRLLGGPLPRVHIVFKQHPGERDEGFYRDLLVGLAAAGGYDPPQISVVKDVDLYSLLRSADAHLGLHSTVLTDAVVADVPNLIAMTDAHRDLIGYVEAGVSRPVADVPAVLAALDDPVTAERERRTAFLEDHFRPGDATSRIIEAIEHELESPTRTSRVPAC